MRRWGRREETHDGGASMLQCREEGQELRLTVLWSRLVVANGRANSGYEKVLEERGVWWRRVACSVCV